MHADSGGYMSKCWCTDCKGAWRTVRTARKHSKKRRLVSQIHEEQNNASAAGLVSYSEPQNDAPAPGSEVQDDINAGLNDPEAPGVKEALAAAEYDPLSLLRQRTSEEGGDGGGVGPIGRAGLNEAELTLVLLDLLCAHKITDSAAEDMWNVVKMLLPPDIDAKSFRTVKKILDDHRDKTVVRIDVCPNDCIAYWDSSYLATPVRNAYRMKCPVCGVSRYVDDPQVRSASGECARKARKVRQFDFSRKH